MSLILDALRKSERSRQQSLTGRLGTAETPPAKSHLPVPWTTLLGLLLLVNAVVLGVLLLGPRSTPDTTTAVRADRAAAPTGPAADYRPSVRPLSQEAAEPAAPSAPAAPAAVQAAPALQPVVASNAAALPTYDGLTPDQRQGMPDLHMDVHAYNPDPAQRFVVINLKRYSVGDTLAEGPTVKDIVPLGVVLEYHGLVFLLSAH